MDESRLLALLERYIEGMLSDAERAELEDLLRASPPARRTFWEYLEQHAGIWELRQEERGVEGVGAPMADPSVPRRKTRRSFRAHQLRRSRYPGMPIAIAASLLLGLLLILSLSSSRPSPQGHKDVEAVRARDRREAQEVPKRQAPAVDPGAEEAARAEQERLTRELAAVEAQRQKLEAARKDAQAESDRRRAEAELEQVAARFREKAAELEKAKEVAEKARKQVPPTPPQAVQETKAAVAKVAQAENAFVVTADGAKTPARAGQDVLAGQCLEVFAGGSARLEYPDGTKVEAWAETEVRELKAEGGKRVHVAKGTVRAEVTKQPQGQPMVFATPHGEATVRGTTLRLSADPDPKKGTRLEVEEGKVQLRNLAGKTVTVESGHYAVAAVGVELVTRSFVLFREDFNRSRINTWPAGWRRSDAVEHFLVVADKADSKNRVLLACPPPALANDSQNAIVPYVVKATSYVVRARMRFEGKDFSRAGIEVGKLLAEYDGQRQGVRFAIHNIDLPPNEALANVIPLNLDSGAWHAWRVEVRGTSAKLVVDGKDVGQVEAADLQRWTAAEGGISPVFKGTGFAEFDDIEILSLDRQ